MSKKKVGRPKINDKEVKKVKSIRLTETAEKLIRKKYNNSIQQWIDHKINLEFKKTTR